MSKANPIPVHEAPLEAFIRRHWGIAPGLLRTALDAPICTAEDMLTIIRGVSDAIGAGGPFNTRYFVDGLQVTLDHPLEQAFVLGSSDHTLADYIDTVTARLDGRPFCLVIDDAALLHPGVWAAMRAFAARIVQHTGYPTGRIEFNAFVGTAAFTPFGIHSDKSHTLTMLAGAASKTMLTWPPAALTPIRPSRVTKDPDRMTLLAGEAASWCLSASTDLLYIPAGWWHVSRKRAGCPFQASLALGFALEQTPIEDLAEMVARELRSALEPEMTRRNLDRDRAIHPMVDGTLDTRPAISAQNSLALELARQALAPGGGVMEAVDAGLRRRTLHRLSGLVESTRTRDLEPVFPPPLPDCLPAGANRVRLVCPLFQGEVAGQWILAANGFSFPLPEPSGHVARAVSLLEGGHAVLLETLGPDDREVRRFLDFAWSCRALAVVE